jgi:hypothetical protein
VCQNGSINSTKKPPQFDGSNYPHWKAKMTTYIKPINKKGVEGGEDQI